MIDYLVVLMLHVEGVSGDHVDFGRLEEVVDRELSRSKMAIQDTACLLVQLGGQSDETLVLGGVLLADSAPSLVVRGEHGELAARVVEHLVPESLGGDDLSRAEEQIRILVSDRVTSIIIVQISWYTLEILWYSRQWLLVLQLPAQRVRRRSEHPVDDVNHAVRRADVRADDAGVDSAAFDHQAVTGAWRYSTLKS